MILILFNQSEGTGETCDKIAPNKRPQSEEAPPIFAFQLITCSYDSP